jgi:hypothetical protein
MAVPRNVTSMGMSYCVKRRRAAALPVGQCDGKIIQHLFWGQTRVVILKPSKMDEHFLSWETNIYIGRILAYAK